MDLHQMLLIMIFYIASEMSKMKDVDQNFDAFDCLYCVRIFNFIVL